MECETIKYILPPGIAWAGIILPLLLIIAGALKLHGGVGWSAATAVEDLDLYLHNAGYLPENYRVGLIQEENQ